MTVQLSLSLNMIKLEDHVETALLNIGQEDLLRDRGFCLTSVFRLPTKLPHFEVLTLSKKLQLKQLPLGKYPAVGELL